MKIKVRKMIAILLSFILILSITGCQSIMKRIRPQNKNKTSQQKGQDKKDPPNSLSKIEKSIETLIKDAEKVQKTKESSQTTFTQQGDQDKEKKEKGKEDKGKQDQEKQGKEKQGKEEKGKGEKKSAKEKKDEKSKKKKDEAKQIDWKKAEKTINDIHTQWNSYEGQSLKDGANPNLVYQFEKSLTDLTNKVMKKDESAMMAAANKTYGYIPDFLLLYKHKAPPEIKKMKFYIRQALYGSENDKWEESTEAMTHVKQVWNTAQLKMVKKDPKITDKTSLSIQDLDDSIKIRNKDMVQIKGQILLNNIEEIK